MISHPWRTPAAVLCLLAGLSLRGPDRAAAAAGPAAPSEAQSSTATLALAGGKALSRNEREAIIAAANRTMRSSMRDPRRKAEPPAPQTDHVYPSIPRDLWEEEIARLKPLRVRNVHLNVFIVLADYGDREEGLLVSNPYSSYAPGYDPGGRVVLLETLSQEEDRSFGVLYRCTLRKAETPEKPGK